jgi:hypothetical protein
MIYDSVVIGGAVLVCPVTLILLQVMMSFVRPSGAQP